MGVVPTGLSYYLLQIGLQSASATMASVVMLLEPAVAAILAWLLLGEALTVFQFGGAALLLVSVVLLSWPTGKPESGAVPALPDQPDPRKRT